jgi:nicotinamidase-related amidase
MTTQALLVVDWEKEWTDPESDYYVGDLAVATKKMNKLIAFCMSEGCRVIFIRHVEKASDGAFSRSSANVDFIDGLDVGKTDTVITKYKISPFFGTNLAAKLKGIRKVVVAGILTNLCVRSTVQDAYDRDFAVTVIQDCCQAFDGATHRFTIKDLKATREEIEFLNLSKFIKAGKARRI